MTKQTKMLLTVGGVAVVGYLLWKQGVFSSKKSNFRGGSTSRIRTGSGVPICRQGCATSTGQLVTSGSGLTGQCAVPIYGSTLDNTVTTFAIYNCTGTSEADLSYSHTQASSLRQYTGVGSTKPGMATVGTH